MQDYYDVLEVSPRAGHDVIDAAYRALTRRLSQTAEDDPTAQRKRELVNEAYAVLSAPLSRQRYDIQRIERHASKQLAIDESQRQAIRHPLVYFLRTQGWYLLFLYSFTNLLWMAVSFVTGDVGWRDVAFVAVFSAVMTGAAGLAYFASWWRMSAPAVVVACVIYPPAGYALLLLASWRSPSVEGAILSAVFSVFLTLFTLIHSLDGEASPDQASNGDLPGTGLSL